MKSVFCLFVLLISLFLGGCVDLAVNDGKNKHKDLKNIMPAKGTVYTMRGGLGGIFSKGMNRLEDTLDHDYHIYASSTVWYKANQLSQTIIEDYKNHKIRSPIILVGHSLGGNEQIKVARKLAQANISVALLITVDAVSPLPVPANVKQVVNIYRPSFVPLFSGQRLQALCPQCTHIENINVTTLKNMDVNHFTIDGNKQVQKLMTEKVLATIQNNERH